jgi:predicted negative regulator of RcsB-dependent stress response
MVGDQQLKGNILLEMGKIDDAQKAYEAGLKLNSESNLSQEIKDNAALFHHYNLARIALARKDLAKAKTETDTFQKGAEQKKNSFLIKQGHELLGRIALQEKNYDSAIAELNQSNLQNPGDLFLLGEAYQGKGDAAKAKEFFTKAAKFNSLPLLPYALVRNKAEKSIAT